MPDFSKLETIKEAIVRGKRISFSYATGDEVPTTRIVDGYVCGIPSDGDVKEVLMGRQISKDNAMENGEAIRRFIFNKIEDVEVLDTDAEPATIAADPSRWREIYAQAD